MRGPLRRRPLRPLAVAALLALPPAGALVAVVAVPAAPAAAQAQPDLGSEAQRAAGKAVYDKWCGQCHGDAGDGQGIATPHLLPEPRDFTSGKYKFRSTPFGALPTEADLRRSIENGLPGTGMPGFPELSDDEVTNVIHYLKTFADDWQDPAAYAEPVALPDPPPFSAERAERGAEAYVEIGCARCHGDEGRGDGRSAPTLRDDWGDFIRAADLTKPWTFRGGASRADIFRTLTTGVYGTPMAAFGDALSEEDRWAIVDWIVARAGGEGAAAPYGRLVRAVPIEGDLVLPEDPAAVRELFADAPGTLLPLIGQVMEPGRAFRPAVREVEVRAVFNRDDVAFLVSWHDMSAETGGENRPDMEVPLFSERGQRAEEAGETAAGETPEAPAEAEPAGEELGGEAGSGADDFWGTGGGEAAAPAAEDEGGQDGGGFWGDEGGDAGGGFESLAAEPAAPASPWSDAVALQFPAELRPGVAKPYFLFGDPSYPVELWHVDLGRDGLAAAGDAALWEGRGSGQLARLDRKGPRVAAHFEDGRWSVAFVRSRTGAGGPDFAEDLFVPLAATVWDGFSEERGNKRALTAWYHVHLPPLEAPSPVGPMLRAGLGVLGLELLIVVWARRRWGRGAAPAATATATATAATDPSHR
jgi:mono/diheme cytochrome c family protein